MSELLLWFLLFLPMTGAVISYLIGRKNKSMRDYFVMLIACTEVLLAVGLLLAVKNGTSLSTGVENIMGLGLHFTTDGFFCQY